MGGGENLGTYYMVGGAVVCAPGGDFYLIGNNMVRVMVISIHFTTRYFTYFFFCLDAG